MGRSGQLGADLNQLEDAQTGCAHETQDEHRQSGLRENQTAAALAAVTDAKLVSVINAPAGSGKARMLAEAGRIWAVAGPGPVIGPIVGDRSAVAGGELTGDDAASSLLVEVEVEPGPYHPVPGGKLRCQRASCRCRRARATSPPGHIWLPGIPAGLSSLARVPKPGIR
jgi:hypothetical protein